MNTTQRAQLVQWLHREFTRLAFTGDKHGFCFTVDKPVAPPAGITPTLWGDIRHAPPVPMSAPRCLMAADTTAGQQRRFQHARELLQKVAA